MIKKSHFLLVFLFLLFFWIIHMFQIQSIINTDLYVTSKDNSIISIFTGPFLHINLDHLISNTKILLVCLPVLVRFYKTHVFKVLFLGIIFPSLFCYFLGMRVIGISGLVFTALWFIIFAGFSSKNNIAFFISLIFTFHLSFTITGITPLVGPGIAWQAHLMGFIIAIILTVDYNLIKKPRKTISDKS